MHNKAMAVNDAMIRFRDETKFFADKSERYLLSLLLDNDETIPDSLLQLVNITGYAGTSSLRLPSATAMIIPFWGSGVMPQVVANYWLELRIKLLTSGYRGKKQI